jgi:hypothetical protein
VAEFCGFEGGAVAAGAGGFAGVEVAAGAGGAGFLAGAAPSSARPVTSKKGPRATNIKTLPKTVRDMVRSLREFGAASFFVLLGSKHFDGEWRGWNRVILLVDLKSERDLAGGGGCRSLRIGYEFDHEA